MKSKTSASKKRRYYGSKKVSKSTKLFVKKQISKTIETKYYEVGLLPAAVNFAGQMYLISDIPQGTTDSNRIGDKVTLRSVHLKYQVIDADPTQLFRVMLIQWKPNTALLAPTIGNILNPVTLGTVNAPLAFPTYDYKNQYRVLYDRLHNLANVWKINVAVSKKIKLKFAKHQIDFTATSTQASNHLYLVVVSDSGAVSHPTFQFQTSVFYDDA